jgi:hypothetical protein
MDEKTRGVVLIATTDRECERRCSAALSEAGFRTTTAYSSYSVEYVLQRHDIDVFLFDAHIFAKDPETRRKAVLAYAPHTYLAVTGGASLNGSLRELVTSRRGRVIDLRCDPAEVVRVVEELMSQREEPRAAPDIEERELARASLPRLAHELGERVKELNYLYSMADLTGKSGLSLKEMLQRLVDMIPAAWQYPEVTCARIFVHGQEFRTDNFRETGRKQAADVIRSGEKIGAVEISYLDERPESAEEPFLKEERDLIDAIAQRVGETVSHIP